MNEPGRCGCVILSSCVSSLTLARCAGVSVVSVYRGMDSMFYSSAEIFFSASASSSSWPSYMSRIISFSWPLVRPVSISPSLSPTRRSVIARSIKVRCRSPLRTRLSLLRSLEGGRRSGGRGVDVGDRSSVMGVLGSRAGGGRTGVRNSASSSASSTTRIIIAYTSRLIVASTTTLGPYANAARAFRAARLDDRVAGISRVTSKASSRFAL
mmetsp:Transcript_9330/g.29813  ORF Transcript_9330/g.29813 Transcript_9330/m.29813 type:complete len:211 (-) Transcript_9330:11-643(-)